MTLIDLDQPAERATDGERRLSRWRIAGVALVALLIGAGLGGLIIHRWTVQRQRSVDGREVSVLLFADRPAGSSAVGSVNSDGIVQVRFGAAIAVVNAGPLPIELRSLVAQKAGLTVTGSTGPQRIAPGTSFSLEVDVTANCVIHEADGGTGASIDGGIMPATVSVRTFGGSVATVSSLSLDTGLWTPQFQAALVTCLQSQT